MARVLLINDEADLLELCELVLEGAGHSALRAFTDGQARYVARAKEFRPDVILLDLVMPHASGAEVLRALRRAPETARTPVVIMSALPNADEVAQDMGAEGFLEKPFDPDELLAAVDAALAATDGDAGLPRHPRAPKDHERP